MSLDAILEVAIGLVFSWLVLSAAGSQVQEWINNLFHLRSVYLEKGILNILGDQALVDKFFQHPVIQALCEQNPKTGKFLKPSYIPAAKFAQAALDTLVSADLSSPASNLSQDQIQAAIANLKQDPQSPQLIDHIFPNLENKLLTTEYTVAYTQSKLEQQFDASMDRATGWYKRNSQKLALGIGMVLALGLNVDTVQVANQLWTQPTQRSMLVSQAQNGPTATQSDNFVQLYNQAKNFNLPIGWETQPADCQQIGYIPGRTVHPGFGAATGGCQQIVNLPGMNDLWGWLGKIFGLLISGFAASQGAPFWFNALNKLLGLRTSGPVPPPAQTPTSSAPAPISFPPPPAAPPDLPIPTDSSIPVPPMPAPADPQSPADQPQPVG
jgi:hypothetical protein